MVVFVAGRASVDDDTAAAGFVTAGLRPREVPRVVGAGTDGVPEKWNRSRPRPSGVVVRMAHSKGAVGRVKRTCV